VSHAEAAHGDPGAVRYSVEDGVAWITLDRPEARNALNAQLRTGLWDVFARFNEDETAQVAVLRGAGPAFCAGGDLKEMVDTAMAVPPPDYLPYLHRTLDVPKPVIAAVHGVAFGGGFLLAQMADLCIAADDARFGITEARWGRGAPWAAPLPWLIPPRAAMEVLLTGEPFTAGRAYELGLVNRVVPPSELQAAAAALAGVVAGNAPLTVRAGKAMVLASAELGWRAALDRADEIFEPVYRSADALEGPRAFQERRAPRWQGV